MKFEEKKCKNLQEVYSEIVKAKSLSNAVVLLKEEVLENVSLPTILLVKATNHEKWSEVVQLKTDETDMTFKPVADPEVFIFISLE